MVLHITVEIGGITSEAEVCTWFLLHSPEVKKVQTLSHISVRVGAFLTFAFSSADLEIATLMSVCPSRKYPASPIAAGLYTETHRIEYFALEILFFF